MTRQSVVIAVLMLSGLTACNSPPDRMVDPTRRAQAPTDTSGQPRAELEPIEPSRRTIGSQVEPRPSSSPNGSPPSTDTPKPAPALPSTVTPDSTPKTPPVASPTRPDVVAKPPARAAAPETPQVARVLRVGANQAIKTIADAARQARDGDTVEIQAGDYREDVAVWTQRNLTIRGVGGTPRLDAGGRSAEGKAIFVMRGDNMTVVNIEFLNCKVPSKNGAGIRLEAGQLTVENSIFSGNENGILTGNLPSIALRITNSSFVENGSGTGSSHNIYVGQIGRFEVENSYFSRANAGHLLKSRARENYIRYNRLTDESSGRASYELEFANGGLAYVVGNLIEQSSNSPNNVIVSYGVEGLTWPNNLLTMAHNTLVNNKAAAPQTIFVRVSHDAPAQLVNNLFVGPGQLQIGAKGDERGNRTVTLEEFSGPARYDFRIRAASKLAAPLQAAGQVNGVSLNAAREYVHPRASREVAYRALPGAFQIVGP